MKVYIDDNNNCVNIGEWVFITTEDADGNEVIVNPIPDNVTEQDREVVTNPDGSRVLGS